MPSDYKKYKFLKDTLEEVANVYGYKMMKTACIEESNLFSCNFKNEINDKMFSIENRFTNIEEQMEIMQDAFDELLFMGVM
jgi:histidyl-tRNA synthetase